MNKRRPRCRRRREGGAESLDDLLLRSVVAELQAALQPPLTLTEAVRQMVWEGRRRSKKTPRSRPHHGARFRR